jgi:hypothetical protein
MTKKEPFMIQEVRAAKLFLDLRDRRINPAGHFDGAGRFYLDEIYQCCAAVHNPSRAYPYTQMVHGRTASHVAQACGISRTKILSVAREIEKREIEKMNFDEILCALTAPEDRPLLIGVVKDEALAAALL